ncbi:T9SS type A sorting domain-containing protein [Candidatus Poribacteria bacterium]|nr:T9SS type A sorting domain-containing protein [Candidatus Poribacteria bacterium]
MDSSVTVIDTQTDTVLKSIPMPTNATGITNDGESRVLVLSAGDFNLIPGNLSIIDTTTDEVEKTVRLRTTPGFSLVLNSKKQVFMNDGFLTNRGLLVYDLASEKWIRDRNDALADFTGGAGLAVDQNDNVYVTIPDWTGGGQDELRVMAPDETLIKTYRVGPAASIVAIAQLAPSEIAKADVNSDGAVDLFDLVLVANHFGEVGSAIIGDLNSDGIVNILDLVLVSAHFGERVFAAPFGKVVDPKLDNKRIQQAIAALESYPDESPTIRRIADYLRLYLENPAPTVTDTELLANYPNPFNPETWIPFQLSASSPVIVRIYDGQGQLVRNLELGYQRAGVYTSKSQAAFWDGKNEIGERVTSGVYFYQLLADHFTATRKMAILK